MSYCHHLGKFKYVKMLTSGKFFQVYKYCLDCDKKYGPVVSVLKTGVKIEDIETYDVEDAKARSIEEEKIRMDEYASKCAERELEHGARVRISKDVFFERYSEYLQSDAWKEKRLIVLHRDKYLCQACLVDGATEVHHTTYKHVGNEPLFELVAVCHKCHEEITKMDRGQL